MEQVIVFDGIGTPAPYIDINSLVDIEANSIEELRLKVRGLLLAQLDELVDQISNSYFRTCFITKAGQKVFADDLKFINSIPDGYGAVTQSSWRATRGCWEDWSLYFVPAGSNLPDGKKLKEGEWIQLKYNWYKLGKEGERLEAFFKDKQNLVNWEKQYGQCAVEDAES